MKGPFNLNNITIDGNSLLYTDRYNFEKAFGNIDKFPLTDLMEHAIGPMLVACYVTERKMAFIRDLNNYIINNRSKFKNINEDIKELKFKYRNTVELTEGKRNPINFGDYMLVCCYLNEEGRYEIELKSIIKQFLNTIDLLEIYNDDVIKYPRNYYHDMRDYFNKHFEKEYANVYNVGRRYDFMTDYIDDVKSDDELSLSKMIEISTDNYVRVCYQERINNARYLQW